MKTINLPSMTQLTIFYYVVDLNSFSKAAEQLGHSKSHISQQVRILEEQFQIRLIERNTRKMALTLAGEQLFQHARYIVEECQAATNTLARLRDKPEGLLRITAPSAYCAHRLAPIMPEFLKHYPDIKVDLRTTAELLDLVRDKIDIAIRLTYTPPEDRIAKRIDSYQLLVCASPAYLNQHEEPKHPNDLNQHATLNYGIEKRSYRWRFLMNGTETHIDVKSTLACNTYEPILEAVTAGIGIAHLPNYVVEKAVSAGKLNLILTEYTPPEIPIYLIYAQQPSIPPSIRAFVEFLQEK